MTHGIVRRVRAAAARDASQNSATMAELLEAQFELRQALAGGDPAEINEARARLSAAQAARSAACRPVPTRMWGEVRPC